MKTTFIFILILLTGFLKEANAQSEPIDETEVRKDSVCVDSIAFVLKNNSLGIEAFRKNAIENSIKVREKIERLGFDYELIEGETGGFRYGGYSYGTILYKLVHFKGKLVGFRLEPFLPNDKRLTDRYFKIFAHLFKTDDSVLEPFFYNFLDSSSPLPDYSGSLTYINDEVRFFMTPFVGVEYGMYGAYHPLSERTYFEKITKYITPQVCELLMYSKNAATRLYAIEYYYRNQELFKENKERIERRIKVGFDEVPEIRTHYS